MPNLLLAKQTITPFYIIVPEIAFTKTIKPVQGGLMKYYDKDYALSKAQEMVYADKCERALVIQCIPIARVGEEPKQVPVTMLNDLVTIRADGT